MELRIKPVSVSKYPLNGILINGDSIRHWIDEVQLMALTLSKLEAYAIPGNKANSTAGCLLIVEEKVSEIYSNEYYQLLNNVLFIPERAELFPAVSVEEIDMLFSGKKHIFHPVFGLAELSEPLIWNELVEPPLFISHRIVAPADKIFLPESIKSFQIESVLPDDLIKKLEQEVFLKKEDDNIKPLDIAEKAKLGIYKALFGEKNLSEGKAAGGINNIPFVKGLNHLLDKTFGIDDKWTEKLHEDYQDLEKRNQNEVERLLNLLKNDPSEALKYAIPIDGEGTGRGFNSGSFSLSRRWFDFSLGGSSGSSGSGFVDLGDRLYDLQTQYERTAEQLIKQNEYHKAAFIYMKLLKNYPKAASTLADGGFYAEAAAIYLKYAFDKQKAAECYEKANMTLEAIKLYKELNDNEKVGDLYLTLKNNAEAMLYFEKVVDAYKSSCQYLKASLVSKYKMKDDSGAQYLLLQGWRNGKDAFNCLNNYFNNIREIKYYSVEINRVYKEEVSVSNREVFLQVLKHEYKKENELHEYIRDISYEIISEHISINPFIVHELQNFNKSDKQLMKDVFQFNTLK